MLFVPYIAKDFGPGVQFKVSGLLALTWLAMWCRVGSDQPPDSGGNSGGTRQAGSPILIEEGGMEAVPQFNKKEDPMPLLQPKFGRSNSADGGGGGGKGLNQRGGCRPDGSAGIPWRVLMQSSAVWAIVTNNFAFHYATYVLMNWLPTYFQSHIGVGLSDMSSWYTVSFREDACLRIPPRGLCCRPVSLFTGREGQKACERVSKLEITRVYSLNQSTATSRRFL